MTEAVAVSEIICPKCAWAYAPIQPGATECPHCHWRGKAYTFFPRQVEIVAAETAVADDATCLHHPRKKAVAVCAGTGDYICSLCAIELNGTTYSAQYLNAGGKETVGKAFDRTIKRPDTQVYTYLLCCFIPYVNFIFIPFAFIWVPHAFVCYARALRMRREDPLYARLMGRGRVVAIPILLSLVSLLWLIGLIALVAAILDRR